MLHTSPKKAPSIEPITLDFETEAITESPVVVPPRPVGCAILLSGSQPTYVTTGIREALLPIWEGSFPLLFHNAPFDLSVAREHLDLPWPSWERVHDTQYLVFFHNPYGKVSLKNAAEAILGIPPDEQADLRDWILANVPGSTPKNFGAYISKAPVELVEPYAKADVLMTRALFDALIEENG